ncbi:MAG: BTAD domain-containing putative transcriptional regulator [Trueperaceae bacterium]|nr:BTAD domain-containing putative transcriptional regulator [Trueperaceae bacterium]
MSERVHLLGPPEVRADGAWAPLSPTKPHAVFAYAAHLGVPVRRAEVAALLWSEADAHHAHAGLRQALLRLHEGPFGDLVAADRTRVWVDGTADVHAFREALAARRWRAAVGAYGGPLLQGFEVDDAEEFGAWLGSERMVVENDWRRACRALIGEAHDAGRLEDVLELADRLVHADSLDERATRDAMSAAAALGDLRGVERRYRALEALLRSEFAMTPEPATRALHEALVAGSAAALAAGTERAPPVRLTTHVARGRSVLGRDRALAELSTLLRRDDARLVTLLGPGGIGKTTLATAAASRVRPAFPDGVFVAPLEGAAGSDAVARMVARATGVAVNPRAPIAPQLAATLDGRRALLVLDAFETHLGEVATVDALVRGTSELHLLVTSRTRLQLSDEYIVDVEPLETQANGRDPATFAAPGAAPASPAAQLFVRTAAHRAPAEVVRGFDLATVEHVVTALGGHPLAIELAAAWMDVVDLDVLEAQLRTSWAPLQSDDADRSPRRSDVLAVIEEIWGQLGDGDRRAWARLAVMPGSLDRGVAVDVAGVGWRGLVRLRDRALWRHRRERIELHALIARFGRERADAEGWVDAAWEAAARAWRTRIAQEVDPRTGHLQRWHPHDVEQALGAWRWAVAHGDAPVLADLAVGLMRALDQLGRGAEIEALGSQAVATLRSPTARRRFAGAPGRPRERALARLWSMLGSDPVARSRNATRAWTLGLRAGDDLAVALALAGLIGSAPTTCATKRLASARVAFERAGDPIGLAHLLTDRGMRLVYIGRTDEGVALLNEALPLLRALGDVQGEIWLHQCLAAAPMLRGDLVAVLRHFADARACAAAAGGLGHPQEVFQGEVWWAAITAPHEVAEERYTAYLAWVARQGGAPVAEAGIGCEFRFRFGTPHEAIEQARVALAVTGAPKRVIPVGALASQQLAASHARLGELAEATAALAEALRMAQALESPRFLAHTALTAAEVAAARGDRARARALLDLAWHHPGLAWDLHAQAETLAERLAVPWPPEAAPPTDDAEVETAVAGLLTDAGRTDGEAAPAVGSGTGREAQSASRPARR